MNKHMQSPYAPLMLRLLVFCLLIVLGGSLPSLSRAAHPLPQTVAPPTFGVAEATSITDSEGNTYDPAALAAQVGLTPNNATTDFSLYITDAPGLGLAAGISIDLTFPFDIPRDSQVTVEGYLSDGAGNRVTAQPAAGIFQAGVGGVVLAPNQISVSASVIYDPNLTDSYQFHWDSLRIVPMADIFGVVSDESGQPLPDVTLTTGSGLTTTSDPHGDYRFDNLLSGNHTLTPTRSGYVFTPTQTTITLPPTAYDVNFVGVPGYTISGAISDESGQPLPDVTLTTDSGLTATSDLNGDYSFSNLLSGSYTLTPTLSGYSFTPPFATTTLPPDASAVDFTAAPENLLSVTVYDPHNNPINTLSLNNEGWYAENPISITVSISNTTGQPIAAPDLTLTIDTPIVRFHVISEMGLGQGTYSNTGYEESVTLAPIGVNDSATVSWRVWVQPDVARGFNVSAALTDGGRPVGQNSATVNIPQANIHPVVLVAGFLGTWPPKPDGELDPLTHAYDNLLAGLEQTGYIPGEPGTAATLIPFGYDWRQHLGDIGRTELAADVQAIVNTPAAERHAYVDYSQVNIIAHSAGGLVSRAFIEDATANNEQLVNQFITLGTPHRGLPQAYRGWYGGQWDSFFMSQAMADVIIYGLYLCDADLGNLVQGNIDSPQEVVVDEDKLWQYIRNHIPSSQDFLPVADVMPEYLVENRPPFNNVYPFGLPPNQFLADMQTPGGDYDIDKLTIGALSTKSYYSSDLGVEIQHIVDPLPGGIPADPHNTRWGFGEVSRTIELANAGDGFIPAYSADITNIARLNGSPNITKTLSSDPPPGGTGVDHISLVAFPENVRALITDLTDVAIKADENIWNIDIRPPFNPIIAGLRIGLTTCSPVRTLVTDPLGRRAGLNPATGQIINEIPNAIVTKDGDEPHLIIIPRLEGQYQVQMQGTGDGDYRLGLMRLFNDDNRVSASLFTGTATTDYTRQITFESAAYQEQNGLVVVEAEKFTWNVGREEQHWIEASILEGYTSAGYMKTAFDIDKIYTQPYTTTSPELQYAIEFTTPGTYYLWLRGYAPNGAGDSAYLGFDNQLIATLTGFAPRQWSWTNQNIEDRSVTVEITEPGVHTLHLWQREDGIRLDQIVLTQDSHYNPAADNLNESPRVPFD